jgi:hypothetical protein
MTNLGLLFNRKPYPVPRASLSDFLNHHRDLSDATTYQVRSPVAPAVFQAFVGSLAAGHKISVTQANAVPLFLLAKEFAISGLAAECARFPVSVGDLASVSERISRIERQVSSFSTATRTLEERLGSQERELENLRLGMGRRTSAADSADDSETEPAALRRAVLQLERTLSGARFGFRWASRNHEGDSFGIFRG